MLMRSGNFKAFKSKSNDGLDQITASVAIRVVESESVKVGKSLKIGKNRLKSEKTDLISY